MGHREGSGAAGPHPAAAAGHPHPLEPVAGGGGVRQVVSFSLVQLNKSDQIAFLSSSVNGMLFSVMHFMGTLAVFVQLVCLSHVL